jgi:hypothetical protein
MLRMSWRMRMGRWTRRKTKVAVYESNRGQFHQTESFEQQDLRSRQLLRSLFRNALVLLRKPCPEPLSRMNFHLVALDRTLRWR